MRHKKDIRKLGRNKSHRKALMRNMAISFFLYKKIQTTESKAKELRKVVEKLVTMAKGGELADIRRANALLNNKKALNALQEIAPKYADRNGGYTKITRLIPRRGDAAKMVLIELT